MLKRCFSAIILISFLAMLSGCSRRRDNAVDTAGKDSFLYLVAGLDDAANNTDVLFTVGYDAEGAVLRVAQIPRDTYIRSASSQNKINQIYATRLDEGATKEEAFAYLAKELERAFGMRLDGYLAVDLASFRELVDVLGGVEIELSHDMTFTTDTGEQITLKAGKNCISGDMAESFIRYRSGYAMGDLGRLDAQKLFLNALFGALRGNMTLPVISRISAICKSEAITDLSFPADIRPIIDTVRDGREKTTVFATVPGEPAIGKNGISYYVLNRKSAAEMAKSYMFAFRAFDPDRRFFDGESDAFSNIYEDDGIAIREYTADSIKDINIIGRGI